MKAVDFASFGTPTGGCGAFKTSSCDVGSAAVKYVEQMCVGKASCVLPADTTIRKTLSPLDQLFGDPCPGQQKWLSFQLSGCDGTVTMADVTPSPAPIPAAPIILSNTGDYVVFDYGQEVGGFSDFSFGTVSGGPQSFNVAYSESSYYSCTGDASKGANGPDGFLSITNIESNAKYTPPVGRMRGGFRYLTIILTSNGTALVNPPTIEMVAAPNMPDPSAWQNHFYSSDDLINRIWYGCGWTTQLCSINTSLGRQWPAPANGDGWNNGANVGYGEVTLVDGAKRDRTIWPGDMGVSVLTALATTGDFLASKNALITLYGMQRADGMLPYAGPPVNFIGSSDTYHLWTLIGTYNIAILANQHDLLQRVWAGFKRGIDACTSRISPTSGLFNVIHNADWARGGQGGENVAGNALLYRALICGVAMANAIGDSNTSLSYTDLANKLQTAINSQLWDDKVGAFIDNPKSSIHPQDGNSLMTWFNATTNDRTARISAYLKSNWNEFGSKSPEWNGNIGTFPGSMEVHAHFASGEAERAHDLIRLEWGYMIDKPEGTQSTFWEGYLSDGTFAYRGDYMSNAHGWATGPAAALTFNTLGIQPGEGRSFSVVPQPGGLSSCEGSFAFGNNQRVFVQWKNESDSFQLVTDSTSYVNSTGNIRLRLNKKLPTAVHVNNRVVWSSVKEGYNLSSMGLTNATLSVTSHHMTITNVPAQHVVVRLEY